MFGNNDPAKIKDKVLKLAKQANDLAFDESMATDASIMDLAIFYNKHNDAKEAVVKEKRKRDKELKEVQGALTVVEDRFGLQKTKVARNSIPTAMTNSTNLARDGDARTIMAAAHPAGSIVDLSGLAATCGKSTRPPGNGAQAFAQIAKSSLSHLDDVLVDSYTPRPFVSPTPHSFVSPVGKSNYCPPGMSKEQHELLSDQLQRLQGLMEGLKKSGQTGARLEQLEKKHWEVLQKLNPDLFM